MGNFQAMCCSGPIENRPGRDYTPIQHAEVEYFEGHGRAEPIRMLLSHAGCKFTNKYIKMEDWPQLKQDKKLYPSGGLPVLVIDGERHFETMACLRSAAIRLGYYNSKDSLACYHADVVCDMTSDVYNQLGKCMFAPDDEAKTQEFGKFTALINKILVFIEESMQVNGWQFAAGNSLSPADFCVAALYFGFCQNSAFAQNEAIKPLFDSHSQLQHYY